MTPEEVIEYQEQAETAMDVVRPAQAPPCPPWCGLPAGHEGWDVDIVAGEVHRLHERWFGVWFISMVERVNIAGQVDRDPPDLDIRLRDGLAEVAEARTVQRDLAAAADLFASIKDSA